jgi:hypothetical protein
VSKLSSVIAFYGGIAGACLVVLFIMKDYFNFIFDLSISNQLFKKSSKKDEKQE